MPKGKNFSCNNADGTRKKGDYYPTHYSLTKQLLEVEHFPKGITILEPACGEDLAITKELVNHGLTVESRDLSTGHDFLNHNYAEKFDYAITNPPFSLALEFILKLKEIVNKKFALLLPLSYLHGEERYHKIYQDTKFPLKRVNVFTRYPMLDNEKSPLRPDGKYTTGMMVYAWYIWDKYYEGKPEINWISNQEYILNKK